MPIVIEPYRKEHEPAVAAFNQRLQQGGEELIFFRDGEPEYLRTCGRPSALPAAICRPGGRRRARRLRIQAASLSFFLIASSTFHRLLPPLLSEGIINQAYARLGAFC